MNKIKFALILIGVFFQTQLFAIANIEGVRLTETGDIFHGTVGVNLSGSSGDKKEEERDLNFRLDYTKGNNNFLSLFDSKFEETNGVKSSNELFAHLRYTRSVTALLSLEAFVQHQTDDFLLLELRSLVGGGVRYQVYKNEEVWALNAGFGAYRTKEEFSDPLIEKELYERYNSYMNATWKIMEGLGLSNTLYYQPRTTDFGDIYMFNSFELGVAMVAHLKFSFKHKVAYDSEALLDLPRARKEYGFEVAWEF